jgi:hypothetical protein
MKDVISGGSLEPAGFLGDRAAPCERCSTVKRLFVVDGKRICVHCFELNLAEEPRRAGVERREPNNEPRGFGRRFQDGMNSRWISGRSVRSSLAR